jgi:hypothetical protein
MFKKQILPILCFSFTLFFPVAKAQDSTKHDTITYLDKGTWLLGGNLSYLNITTTYNVNSGYGGGYTSGTSSSTEGLFLGSISAAKMLNSYFAIGGKVTYINSSGKDAAFLGPTLRIYINNDGKSILPFMLGELNFSTKEGGTTNYNAGLGLSCFFNKQVSFDVTATYGNKFSINEVPQRQNNTYESFGIFALQVGLQIYLPKKI